VWLAGVRGGSCDCEVHALYEALRDRSFVTMPLTKQRYGDWEFEVRAPNGYRLVFGGDADMPKDGAP
jgi:uncharacterized glyoxalase superfamily protein PhnB